jgi:DNA-binding MarR family transcriptional regulator
MAKVWQQDLIKESGLPIHAVRRVMTALTDNGEITRVRNPSERNRTSYSEHDADLIRAAINDYKQDKGVSAMPPKGEEEEERKPKREPETVAELVETPGPPPPLKSKKRIPPRETDPKKGSLSLVGRLPWWVWLLGAAAVLVGLKYVQNSRQEQTTELAPAVPPPPEPKPFRNWEALFKDV